MKIVAGIAILNNWDADDGGGVYCSNSCMAYFTNNTICGNTALLSGGGINCESASPNITNTIVWNNNAPVNPQIAGGNAKVTYCDVQGGWPGTGNMDADPLFIDSANGDFHIPHHSPCRDAGNNAASGLPQIDFEGDPRLAYGTVDIGADEFYTHLYYTGDSTPGGNVEIKFVGLPGTSPVGLCIGTGVLDPPIPSMWGD